MMLLTTLAAALAAAPDCAPLEAREIHLASLPKRIELFDAATWSADGRAVTGRSLAREHSLFTVLDQAPDNERRIARAIRRREVALAFGWGGLGAELAGGTIVVLAELTPALAAPAAVTIGLPLTVVGATVGITGALMGMRNRPLRRAVDGYNTWAAAEAPGIACGDGAR